MVMAVTSLTDFPLVQRVATLSASRRKGGHMPPLRREVPARGAEESLQGWTLCECADDEDWVLCEVQAQDPEHLHGDNLECPAAAAKAQGMAFKEPCSGNS